MRANLSITIGVCLLAAVSLLITGCGHKVVAPVYVPPAPATLATVAAAKTVFVLNAGQDLYYTGDIPGSVNVTYNEFYASLKQAGRFQLVDDPRKADLVFAIYGTEEDPDTSVVHARTFRHSEEDQVAWYPPYVHLDISEPGSTKPLYWFRWHAGRASNIPKGIIAFANSIDALTAKMMSLFPGQTATLPDATVLVQAVAPVPKAITEGKTIYLRDGSGVSKDYVAALTGAMNAWGHFQIVDTPEKADLIFETDTDSDLTGPTILTGSSAPLKLWTLSRPIAEIYPGYGAKQRRNIAVAVVKRFRVLVETPPVVISSITAISGDTAKAPA
jgi:hypothetical protein